MSTDKGESRFCLIRRLRGGAPWPWILSAKGTDCNYVPMFLTYAEAEFVANKFKEEAGVEFEIQELTVTPTSQSV